MIINTNNLYNHKMKIWVWGHDLAHM